jgi:hypothetical protein
MLELFTTNQKYDSNTLNFYFKLENEFFNYRDRCVLEPPDLPN